MCIFVLQVFEHNSDMFGLSMTLSPIGFQETISKLSLEN